MQDIRWDDLPVFLAVARTGSLTSAAVELDSTPSTMHRRLGQLESALGTRLFDRHPTGLSPTAAGEALLPLAEGVEDGMMTLVRAIAGRDQAPRGRVHLTAPDTLVDLLVEPLATFRQAFPQVHLDVSLADRYFDLSRREADVAVRPSPDPPEDAVGRRVATVAWAVYRPLASPDVPPSALPWATYTGTLERLGASRWHQSHHGDDPVIMAVNGVVAMQRVLRCMTCRAFLPCFLGDPDPALVRAADPVPDAASALWLLVHPDLRRTARVRALADHLWQRLLPHRALFEGTLEPQEPRRDPEQFTGTPNNP